MRKPYALMTYPMSAEFQKKVEARVGESIEYLLLSELREKPLIHLWKFLKSCRPSTFFIPIEDYNSRVLLPILQLVVKMASPERIVIIDSNLNFQEIKLLHILRTAFNLFAATLFVNTHYQLTRQKMSRFLQATPMVAARTTPDAARGLYLNANLWFGVKAGGSVGHVAGVINGLVEKEIVVDYAAVENSALVRSAIQFIQLPQFKRFGVPSILNSYYFNHLIHRHLSSMKEKKWDFIYQRMSMMNFAGVSLSRELKIPLILEYNGSEVWISKHWGRGQVHEAAIRAEEICIKHASLIMTISEVLKQELLDRGVPREKIVYYPNCIDPKIFHPDSFSQKDRLDLLTKYSIPADAQVVTFVGTFGQWHGVPILAQAIKVLIEQHSAWLYEKKVHFLLVGDGVKMSEVKQILGPLLSHPVIKLTGLIPQIEAPRYLAASDILVSPHVRNADGSQFFGSPTKLFEYMAMGKAIIASDLDQIGDVLRHSLRVDHLPKHEPQVSNTELSLLCEPGCVEHLVQSIQFLVEHEAWRKTLGEHARKEALAKYTWAHHVDTFLEKLKKL